MLARAIAAAFYGGRAREVQADQQPLAGQPVGEAADHRRDAHVSDHFERQRRAEHQSCIAAGQIVGQKRQGHRGEPGPDQGDHLGCEQVAVGAKAKRRQHGPSAA